MSAEVEDFLEHYGVKGMKWGVRRSDRLRERSTANSESSRYKQARVDSKALKSAEKTKGVRSKSAEAARATIRERQKNDPQYKAAKATYDYDVRLGKDIKIAAIGLGVIAAPYILNLLDAAYVDYAQKNIEKSLHDTVYKEFERSAYGRRRREQGRMFVDNSKHRVVG